MANHVAWLHDEGRNADETLQHGVYLFSYTVSTPSTAIRLNLEVTERASRIYSNVAYREVLDGTLLQPLNVESSSDFRRLSIEVPECDAHDRVLVLYRIEGVERGEAGDDRSFVRVTVEQ